MALSSWTVNVTPNPQPLQVWLSDWEHRCCGESRRVGQHVGIRVDRSADEVWEQRHADRGSEVLATAMVHGQVLSIKWHRARTTTAGRLTRIVGYEPGIDIATTDDITEHEVPYWIDPKGVRASAIEFTIHLDENSVNASIPEVTASDRSLPPS